MRRARAAEERVDAGEERGGAARGALDDGGGHRARFAKDVDAAKKLIAFGESKADLKLAPADLAAWTLVANLLLNLDEVVNKN